MVYFFQCSAIGWHHTLPFNDFRRVVYRAMRNMHFGASFKVAAATLFIANSPALAQWQTPDYSVPVGRGAGTGFKFAAPGTAGYPLVSNGASSNPSFGAVGSSALPSPFTNGTSSGNTSKFATTTGTLTSGNCAKWDANGNAVDAGACATVTAVSAGTGMSFSTINTSGSVAIDKASSSNYFAGASNKVPTTDVIYQAEVPVTYGTTTTFDFSTFINASVTLTGNITTMTFSNVIAGKAGSIRFIQDGTGSRTTVWNSILKWAGGNAPTLSTAAGAVDVLNYNCLTATFCQAALVKDVK